MENFIDTLTREIYSAIDRKLKNGLFDQTVSGQVVRILPGSSPDRYIVTLTGDEKELKLPSAVEILQPGTPVRITAPCGDLSRRYISSIIK